VLLTQAPRTPAGDVRPAGVHTTRMRAGTPPAAPLPVPPPSP